LNTEWCYYSNAFTSDECDEIVKLGKTYDLTTGFLGDGSYGVDSRRDFTYRNSNLRFIDKDEPGSNWIFDKMWKLAIQCNEEWFNFHISTLPAFQFTEYIGNTENPQFYTEHIDVFWVTEAPFHRKLSAVVQLSENTEYTGGTLEFTSSNQPLHDQQIYEMAQKGTVIFFPSFLQHAVSPVTEGLRHSLVGWFEGPKWR